MRAHACVCVRELRGAISSV
uniref:Uncharacterized protein n=1 Tax=Anopheles dirus TaxID=7168 RepID=A0A182NXR4_9DIPT